MSRALLRRLAKLEIRRLPRFDARTWVTRALNDPAFLRNELENSPARPGSREAAIDAELLASLDSCPSIWSGHK